MKFFPSISAFILFVSALTLCSCQPQHCVLTHSTPHFSDTRHFEASAGMDVFNGGGTANISASPVKYFALHAGGYLYPGIQPQPTYFSKYYEFAAGAYLPVGRSLLAINAGYGAGSSYWHLTSATGYSGYTMREAGFDGYKYFLQAYWCVKDQGEEKIYKGFSAKLSSWQIVYHSASASAGTLNPDYLNRNRQSYSLELMAFYNMQLYKAFYIDFQAGIFAAREDAGLAGRIGLALRL